MTLRKGIGVLGLLGLLLTACSSREPDVSSRAIASERKENPTRILFIKEKDHSFNTAYVVWLVAKQIKGPSRTEFYPWTGFRKAGAKVRRALDPSGLMTRDARDDVRKLQGYAWAFPDRAQVAILDEMKSEQLRSHIDNADLILMDSEHEDFPYALSKGKRLILLDAFRGDLVRGLALRQQGFVVASTGLEQISVSVEEAFADRNKQQRDYVVSQLQRNAGPEWARRFQDQIDKVNATALADEVLRRGITELALENERAAEAERVEEAFAARWQAARDQFVERLPLATDAATAKSLHEFFDDYDRFSLLQTEVALTEILRVARASFPKKFPRFSRRKAKLTNALVELEEGLAHYRRNEASYGTPVDSQRRLSALNPIYAAARKYFSALGYDVQKVSYVDEGHFFLSGVPAWKNIPGDFFSSKRGQVDDTPITASLEDLFRRMGNSAGARLNIDDHDTEAERAAHEESGGVTIYAFNHTAAQRDMVFMSNLRLENTLLVAFGLSYPTIAARALYDDENFIFVGRQGGEPLEMTLKSLEAGQSKRIVIYPEGNLGAAFGAETRRIAPHFVEGLVAPLLRKGYRPMIVPVTCQTCDNFFNRVSFFKTVGGTEDLRGVIGKPLGPDRLQSWIGSGNAQLVSDSIRWSWMSNKTPPGEDRLGGHRRLAQLRDYLGKTLMGAGRTAWLECAQKARKGEACSSPEFP